MTLHWISYTMINKQILFTGFLLLCTIVFFALSNIDIQIQDLLYNTNTHHWLLMKDAQPYELIFYSGIKKLLLGIAVILLAVWIFLRNHPRIKAYKKGLMVVILSAILIPVVTGGLKKTTNMPCPKHLMHYGGNYPHTAVWESYKAPYDTLKSIKCWPAGHASGGFALMSLFFLFRRKCNRYIALGTAIVIGWSMGFYKMLIGDHFFSHTVITMLIAWLIILILQKMLTRLARP